HAAPANLLNELVITHDAGDRVGRTVRFGVGVKRQPAQTAGTEAFQRFTTQGLSALQTMGIVRCVRFRGHKLVLLDIWGSLKRMLHAFAVDWHFSGGCESKASEHLFVTVPVPRCFRWNGAHQSTKPQAPQKLQISSS